MLNIRIKVVTEWRQLWRFWSVWFNAIGISLLSYVSFATEAWNNMPPDLRHTLPYVEKISGAMFVLGFISRFIQQKNAHAAIAQIQQAKEQPDGDQ